MKRAARERNWPSAYRNDTNVKADTHKSCRQRTSGGRRSPAAVLCEFRDVDGPAGTPRGGVGLPRRAWGTPQPSGAPARVPCGARGSCRRDAPRGGGQNRLQSTLRVWRETAGRARLRGPRPRGADDGVEPATRALKRPTLAQPARNTFSAAASSLPSSARGNRWPYVSAVIWMEACPSRACTTLSGSSSPPSTRRLMHQLAQKWLGCGGRGTWPCHRR